MLPAHGQVRRHDRRRRWARVAGVEPRPRDLPRHGAHGRDHQARRRRVLPRGRRWHHACARAAADHARALAQGRAPGHRPVDAREGRRRRVLPEARSARRSGLPPDRAHRVPVGAARRRDLPDRGGRGRLGGPDGHDHLPSVAGARQRRGPSGRAAHRPGPAAGHGLRRRRAGGRPRRACSWRTSATPGSRRPPAAAGCTSTCASSRAGRSPTSATRRSRSGASWSAAFPAR